VDPSQLEHVLADDYVGDVTALGMEDLRSKRAECQALEVALSYQRRLAQGRLDIVAAERRRRAEGGEPPSADDLVASLTAALTDHGSRPAGNGRMPQLMAPDTDEFETPALDAIAGPTSLSRLTELTDDDLAEMVDALSSYEADVSRKRRSLHERIDALQAEITRRYRTGEASVESLLQ
jgi:hypothetical protein